MPLKKIVVFLSGGGSNFQSLLDHVHGIYGEIVLVISDNESAYGLQRAKKNNIDTIVIDNKTIRDDELINILQKYNTDIIVLAGYLKIISKEVVKTYTNKIINIHPSLIPSFCGDGSYGIKVHEMVYNYGVKITGATVHFVDEGTDTGPIIMQKSIDIEDESNPKEIQKKVLKVEHEILPMCVKLLCQDRITLQGRRVKILEEGMVDNESID